uniref:Putative serine protease n=1 Tax=Ixodes scapularis TaxID=6945 RepID=A0A4D5RWG4_IXOSC
MEIFPSLLLVFGAVETASMSKRACGVRGTTNPSGGHSPDRRRREHPATRVSLDGLPPTLHSSEHNRHRLLRGLRHRQTVCHHCENTAYFPNFLFPDNYTVIDGEYYVRGRDCTEKKFPVKNLFIYHRYY